MERDKKSKAIGTLSLVSQYYLRCHTYEYKLLKIITINSFNVITIIHNKQIMIYLKIKIIDLHHVYS